MFLTLISQQIEQPISSCWSLRHHFNLPQLFKTEYQLPSVGATVRGSIQDFPRCFTLKWRNAIPTQYKRYSPIANHVTERLFAAITEEDPHEAILEKQFLQRDNHRPHGAAGCRGAAEYPRPKMPLSFAYQVTLSALEIPVFLELPGHISERWCYLGYHLINLNVNTHDLKVMMICVYESSISYKKECTTSTILSQKYNNLSYDILFASCC